MIKFRLPLFIARWWFPDVIASLEERGKAHGKAKVSKRFLGGAISVEGESELI